MKCTSPTWIKSQSMYVPCGWCEQCLIQRKREWSMRMEHESLYWEHSTFITLTYDEEHVPYSEKDPRWMTLRKKDVQSFMKLLRKNIYPRKIKYYICGEYGPQTNRPHYHGILFGIDFQMDSKQICRAWQKCQWTTERIIESLSPITTDRCAYVAGYVIKKINDRNDEEYAPYGREVPFRIQSQGLGLRYAIEEEDRIIKNKITIQGVPRTVPRYYLRKLGLQGTDIYSEDDRDTRERDENYRLLGVHNNNQELYKGLMSLYWRSEHYKEVKKRNKQRQQNTKIRLQLADEKNKKL